MEANRDYQERARQLQQMREQLRPLDLQTWLVPSPLEQACLQFYGILFTDERVQQSVGYLDHQGQRIALYRFRPQRVSASCFLLHGYYDHVGLYGHLIRFLLENGVEVVAFDLPGHGLSDGERASIDEFGHYRSVLKTLISSAERAALPKPWLGMGQSTGGAILADWALGEGRDCFDQLLLLAPLLRPHRWPLARVAHYLLRPFVKAIPRSYSDNSSDHAFLQFVRHQDPLQPRTLPVAWVGALARWIPHMLAASPSPLAVLVVQGDEDHTVDWRFNLSAYQRLFPAARVLTLAGAGHHLANESIPLRKRYLQWLSQNLILERGGGVEVNGYTRGSIAE
ncbi:alpha/beta hydrolase [Aestuariirhabdus litorea]|uniref:Alpha/beta hydrolase n=1 Tax=Aestuariirhabdus litorea TaxID=2528527 RepID=A0A3P3VJ81_9GAMM|nr:alpha/beta hydrolase [Aestuariirhabdus litorea]RRJ82742.1 alpha/beta hydrolase [Aestuariirhabdus litorea]RWW92902.1 alpha/beta fold hydrolase [Endozoicomonadaceae bacterium GTF-13]